MYTLAFTRKANVDICENSELHTHILLYYTINISSFSIDGNTRYAVQLFAIQQWTKKQCLFK